MQCPNCGKEIANDSQFCEYCGTPTHFSVDDILLNIIEVNSYHPSLFAAYKARKKCYKLCKKNTHRPDYKEYVQHLQLQNFPNEYQKAIIGGRLYWCLWLSSITGIIAIFFSIMGWIFVFDDDEEFLWMAIPSTIVLITIIWFYITEHKRCVEGYKKLVKE